MSLRVYLKVSCVYPGKRVVYTSEVADSLASMAKVVQAYGPVWHPDRESILTAEHLIRPLEFSLGDLGRFVSFGTDYSKQLFEFLLRYLNACKEYPEAIVRTST